MAYPIIFGTAGVGLALITVLWVVLLFRLRHITPAQLVGPAGTLCAAVPIIAAWLPEMFQPLWIVIQLTFSVWLLSFVLIALAVLFAFTLDTRRRHRVVAVACGGAALLLDAAALLTFMWYATVSPGGV